jgi:chromosome segregation ATPase
MGTETTTTIKENDGSTIEAEKATQAETAARGAQIAAETTISQAKAVAADAMGAAAAKVSEARAQIEETAQWTKSQITEFHSRLSGLETKVDSLPDRLASILKPQGKEATTETVTVTAPAELVKQSEDADGQGKTGTRRESKKPPPAKRRFV